jgi:cellulose synthase/poly-beta-1,6-N-acetylglucosamine synthase-like glycosyltransferase
VITLAVVVAWAGVATLVYVYLGYPFLLWLVSRLRPRAVARGDVTESVTLIVSAYNEADVIRSKLDNSLALDYPRDRLEVVVVSDASTDATEAIVREYAAQGVTLFRMSERGGKTAGLNAAMEKVRGDIVVFSDANILYERDVIRKLVRNFADPEVGCVTGDSRYVDPEQASATHGQEDAYWGYERLIRWWESRLGSTVGADGAIFAIRRELYTPLPADAINDLMLPLRIVDHGHRAVFDASAVGFEPSAGDLRREFRRKRRIVNRSWRAVMSVPAVLDPRRTGLFAWQVWSHKVLRWLALPVLLATVAAAAVAYSQGAFYQAVVWGFTGSLAAAGGGLLLPERLGMTAKLGRSALYYYVVNVAAVLGIAQALRGRVQAVWTPER